VSGNNASTSEIVLGIGRVPVYIADMPEPPTVLGVLTAEELLDLHLPDKRTELVRGRLTVREPPGYRHGVIASKIARLIANYVHDHGLGIVVAAETGFKLFSNPDTVRAADAAFLSRHRAPDPPPSGYLALAPDLVVEVVSPNDGAGGVQAKVSDWLTAGSRLVWVIDPGRTRALVYREDGSVDLLANREALSGEDVLPGFSCSLDDVW
jgi:Uma2 family endonuclease